jgi:nucleoside-diphosphate-sugar epimerase
MKSVVILGAAGYIGRHLVARLSQKYIVTAVVRSHTDIFSEYTGVKVFLGDVRVRHEMEKVIKCGSIVINMAGTTTAAEKEEDHFNVNVFGQSIVASIAAHVGARVIYTSSTHVGSGQPADVYSLSKKMAEEIYRLYATRHALPVTSLRLGSVYGERHRKGIVHTMITSAIEKKCIEIPQQNVSRDLIYINDVIDAIEKTMTYRKKGFQIFNVAYGKRQTLKGLARAIGALMPQAIDICTVRRHVYPTHVYADMTKTKKELGFWPKMSLKEGLRRVIDSY